MAEDWAIDVKKYAPDADDGVIAAIVSYCGIALRSRDSSLVSFTDPAETTLVRENYLKKKLGLVDPDPVLDGAIADVGTRMKGDNTRNRVTVYYLLAQHFGKLGVFGTGAPAVVAPGIDAPSFAAAAAVPLTAVAAAPLAAAAVPPLVADHDHRPLAAAPVTAPVKGVMDWLPMALLLLGGIALLWYLTRDKAAPVAPAAVAVTEPAAVAAAAPAPAPAPAGADILASEVDGEPVVSVYFETAKADIDPKFGAITGPIRTYIQLHPDSHLQVSGYNDPRGDAAMNAELSKNRAFAVRDALARLGVAITSIALVKPADTSADTDSLAQARRVDVTVEDGPVPAAEVEPVTP